MNSTLGAAASSFCFAAAAAGQSFQGLGTLNNQDSEATAISADGLVVVGWSSVAFSGSPPGAASRATGRPRQSARAPS
jgi:uncharacterized membrane protein